MYSAFGVDHGGISKGLPSALRGGVPNTAEGKVAGAMIHRRNANAAGRFSPLGKPAGQTAKNQYKQTLGNIGGQNRGKRVLP